MSVCTYILWVVRSVGGAGGGEGRTEAGVTESIILWNTFTLHPPHKIKDWDISLPDSLHDKLCMAHITTTHYLILNMELNDHLFYMCILSTNSISTGYSLVLCGIS